MSKELDLSPYGINLRLTKGIHLESMIRPDMIAKGSFSLSKKLFELPSGNYAMSELIGRGKYGDTYYAYGITDNHIYAIKVIHLRELNDGLLNTVKECIINIILDKESQNEKFGPYVPRVYEIAYDPIRSLIMIRMEKLQDTLYTLYQTSTKEQNDILIPTTLANLAFVMDFFYKRFSFNHRDLKPDNVMYKYDSNNRIHIKLIDFGLTCLTWNDIRIQGTLYTPFVDTNCYLSSRDLTQYVYAIYIGLSKEVISNNMLLTIKDLLTFPIRGKLCKMYSGCPEYGMRKWPDNFDFLNQAFVKNMKCEANTLYKHMKKYIKNGSINDYSYIKTPILKKTEECHPDKILNPKSMRCVNRYSSIGRKLTESSKYKTPDNDSSYIRKSKTRKNARNMPPSHTRKKTYSTLEGIDNIKLLVKKIRDLEKSNKSESEKKQYYIPLFETILKSERSFNKYPQFAIMLYKLLKKIQYDKDEQPSFITLHTNVLGFLDKYV